MCNIFSNILVAKAIQRTKHSNFFRIDSFFKIVAGQSAVLL